MSDPRFDPPPESYEEPLAESVEIFRMFRIEHRTSLRDLLPSLYQMDARLEKYDTAKGGAWRRQSVDTHLIHARGHLDRAMDELKNRHNLIREMTGAMLRLAMAITCLILRTPAHPVSLSTLRADARETVEWRG